MELKYILCT